MKPLKPVLMAAGAVALLVTAGCAATPGASAAPSQAAASPATATAPVSAAGTPAPTASAAAAQDSGKYAERLVLSVPAVKAGGTLPVSGGRLQPGTVVKVYAAQQPVVSFNPATGMWGSAQGEIFLSDTATAVVDAEGHYDVQLVIRAGTPPQTFNVNLILPDGNGSLLQANVE